MQWGKKKNNGVRGVCVVVGGGRHPMVVWLGNEQVPIREAGGRMVVQWWEQAGTRCGVAHGGRRVPTQAGGGWRRCEGTKVQAQ